MSDAGPNGIDEDERREVREKTGALDRVRDTLQTIRFEREAVRGDMARAGTFSDIEREAVEQAFETLDAVEQRAGDDATTLDTDLREREWDRRHAASEGAEDDR